MNILILCHKMPYPPNDGGAIASLNMIVGLNKLAHKVNVLAMQTPKHSFNIKYLPNSLKTITWEQVFVNTKIKIFNALLNLLFSKKPYNAKRFESKKYEEKLISILKQNKFDIIQLEGLYLTSYIKTIRKYSLAKISFRSHNVEWKIWQGMFENETVFFKKIYYKILSKRVKKLEYNTLKKIDLLVTITKNNNDEFNFHTKKNSFTSPTGIFNSNFNSIYNQDFTKFFYLGSLDWLPNQEALLWFLENVWTDIKQTFPDINFTIAGKNAPINFVEKIKKYPICFVGEVESATNFIDQNTVMIVPLFAGSGMRIKIIEAMARSKCVVTTTIGAEGIGVKHMENIVIADNDVEMIEAIELLINEPERIKKISENAYKLIVDKYDNGVLINKLCKFYKTKINQ